MVISVESEIVLSEMRNNNANENANENADKNADEKKRGLAAFFSFHQAKKIHSTSVTPKSW